MPESMVAGLRTAKDVSVPLAGVSVAAEIANLCARVTVTQRYVNRESNPIEATYLFPLDEGAAVCGFEAVIDGTLVVGEVKDRESAFEAYDEAIGRGDSAFLLDEEHADVFQANVGNLPPGTEALLRLTYVTELTVDDGALRFTIPTTVSPRYAPAHDRTGVGRAASDTFNPPRTWTVPYGLDLSIRVMTTGTIARIESLSHPIAVRIDETGATVSLSQDAAPLDRDFVLSIESASLNVPQAWIEAAPGGGDAGENAVAIAFVPRFPTTDAPSEIVFIVDRSGSMEGTSIAEVRNALQLCLRSLTPGCAFNIVSFGNTFAPLFPQSRAYDDTSLNAASAHVRDMRADMGGTEIEPALRFVLDQPRHGGMPRQIVLLTDGEVTNADDVLALGRRHAADTRIFAFAIGAGASHHLVKGLARVGGGASEHIFPGERIEPKVMRLFGRLLSPALTDVRVTWGDLTVTQTPTEIPPVFTGGRLMLYAFVRNLHETTVILSGTTASAPVRFEVNLDPAHVVRGRTVATLAARTRIRELEESPEWLRGSRQQERRASNVREQIVRLGMTYGLASRETSYVAIERRDTPIVGDLKLRRVPIALTHGWGGVDGRRATLRGRAHLAGRAKQPVLSGTVRPSAPPPSAPRPATPVASAPPAGFLNRVFGRRPARDIERSAPPPPPFTALVALQRADGSWDLTRELAGAIGQPFDLLEQDTRGAIGPRADIRAAWATGLALAWLEEHAAAFKDEWQALAAKARQWLARTVARPADGASWVDTASRLLAVRR
jgi:hypothetical protein